LYSGTLYVHVVMMLFLQSATSFRHVTFSTATTSFRRYRHKPSTAAAFTSTQLSDSTILEEHSRTIPLYRTQGLLAVDKPFNWTSNDVVSYIRGILERDARERGARPERVGSRRNKNQIIRVGHGGTLDPLATGVLVIGIGKGTKELQNYLSGSKRYRAGGEFGFETSTLDMEGNVTKTAAFDHITAESLQQAIPSFVGKIQQTPPIFSAIRKDGKKLYEHARQGATIDDVQIESREVEIYNLQVLSSKIPNFEIVLDCGGGTYVRSLIRDIGHKLDSVATTTFLKRTKQGQFDIEDCLVKDDWSADNVYACIDRCNEMRETATANDPQPDDDQSL
jgi:tRNA pseudouridine55 synthase